MTIREFQIKVQHWMLECFGQDITSDQNERNHRFLEESLELVQACGCTADEAHKLVDYVFSRPKGDRLQEAGGVAITLNALCNAQEMDYQIAAETELERICKPDVMDRIRAKQKSRPAMSPLPGSYPPTANHSKKKLR